MSALVIAEHAQGHLHGVTRCAVDAACQLHEQIVILVAGHQCQQVAQQAAMISKVNKVLYCDAPEYEYGLAENLSHLIAGLASDHEYIVAAATSYGKNVLPRVAALLDVSQISDITAIKSSDTFVRPIYAGNVYATVQSLDDRKVITVRASAFEPAANDDVAAEIVEIEPRGDLGLSRFVSSDLTQSARPELTEAEVVVSGGRGIGSTENFRLLEQLADKLGAAVGASRAAVDAGYVPNDFQVGQTGKVVAPKLYIAVGISGAIQHLAGMQDSRVIVAINKDPEAPIFKIADYGIVGDLFTVLPELIAALD